MTAKSIKALILALSISIFFSSCYSYKSVVGAGAYGDIKKSAWNHYLIYGLIPVHVSDSKDMSQNKQDYTVYTRQTVLNFLASFVTLGIYAPTTTTVTVNDGRFENENK